MPPYALHRDARNFVFPDAFWPERWLVASGQLPLARARRPHHAFPGPPSGPQCAPESGIRFQINFVHSSAAFILFSHGRMGCAGKGLAMAENAGCRVRAGAEISDSDQPRGGAA